MNSFSSIVCGLVSNNNLHAWCMESSPYVVLTGTVFFGGYGLIKLYSLFEQTLLSSKDEPASPPLTPRELPPGKAEEGAFADDGDSVMKKDNLVADVEDCLGAAYEKVGEEIEIDLPLYENADELLSIEYLYNFRENFHLLYKLFENQEAIGLFNEAITLIANFYLDRNDGETASQYLQLALDQSCDLDTE